MWPQNEFCTPWENHAPFWEGSWCCHDKRFFHRPKFFLETSTKAKRERREFLGSLDRTQEVKPRDRLDNNILLLQTYQNNLKKSLMNSQQKAAQAMNQTGPHFSPLALFSLNKAKNLQKAAQRNKQHHLYYPCRYTPKQNPAWPLIHKKLLATNPPLNEV